MTLNNKAISVRFASQIVYRHLARISHSGLGETTVVGLSGKQPARTRSGSSRRVYCTVYGEAGIQKGP
jgi:hypothetical protein